MRNFIRLSLYGSIFFVSGNAYSQIFYFVKAIEGDGNPYGMKAGAVSSWASSVGQGQVFIPNAFTPNDIRNNIFIPVCKFVERDDYTFSIYNRWGERIFETTNMDEGWTGKHNSTMYPTGVYVYKIKGVYSSGEKFTKTSSVHLLE